MIKQKDGQKEVVALTTDHKCEDEEAVRIKKNGGHIGKLKNSKGKEVGPNRIWNQKFTMPGLAMSRSLGDKIAHVYGCGEIPDIDQRPILGDEKHIIIASDGVWEVFTNRKAADQFCDDPQEFADNIVQMSEKDWAANFPLGNVDDITCIVI